MEIRPYGPRVLVRILPEEKVTESGLLYLPETAHETAVGSGIVKAVGNGAPITEPPYRRPIDEVKVGDKVYFIKFLKEVHTNVGAAKAMGDEDLLLIELKDILGVEDA